jgi:hypothetical protein
MRARIHSPFSRVVKRELMWVPIWLWPRRTVLRPPGVITVDILPAIPPGMPCPQMFERMVHDIESSSQRLSGNAIKP